MSDNIDVEEMILHVIDQIKDGRDIASKFLEDLESALSGNKESHMTLGPIATQYMSKVQKSDDQIIKLIDILKRSQDKKREETVSFGNIIGASANDSSSVFSDNSDSEDEEDDQNDGDTEEEEESIDELAKILKED